MPFGYQYLLSERQFLRVAERARVLAQNGTTLFAIYFKEGILYFRTRSADNPNIYYTERVKLIDVTPERLLRCKTFRDVENLIRSGNMKVDCTCPADLYWGYKYIRWREGTGIERENRRPVVRNPYEKGHLCKHLFLVLQTFPFLCRTLASKFNQWYRGDTVDTHIKSTNYLNQYKVNSDVGAKPNITIDPNAGDTFTINSDNTDTINNNQTND